MRVRRIVLVSDFTDEMAAAISYLERITRKRLASGLFSSLSTSLTSLPSVFMRKRGSGH
ncbi:MAG: hypothetical protein ABIM74_10055 [candidate division WOR-3 bacterium]